MQLTSWQNQKNVHACRTNNITQFSGAIFQSKVHLVSFGIRLIFIFLVCLTSISSIYMKPKIFFLANYTNFIEIIEGANTRSSKGGDNLQKTLYSNICKMILFKNFKFFLRVYDVSTPRIFLVFWQQHTTIITAVIYFLHLYSKLVIFIMNTYH